MRTSLCIAILLTLATTASWAGSVDKGYKAMQQFDYFKAKKYFTKALKYNESAGAQGLAVIYYRTDNPFHSYDSALVYVNRSLEAFDMTKASKKEKWAVYGFTRDSILRLRQHISTQFYEQAMSEHTVASLTGFVDVHTWANERDAAIHTRDSIAFFQAVHANTANSYQDFMQTYPQSEYVQLAKDNFFDAEYIEMTQDGSLSSYLAFLDTHPTSPMRSNAEKKVFELATEGQSLDVYRDFIVRYPDNHYVDTAWWNWYQLALSDYNADVIHYFLDSTNIPYRVELEQDLSLFDSVFLPYGGNQSFGYMNYKGEVVLPASFQFASFFQEGLAVVARNGKYGFVNKRGEVQIPCTFDSAGDFIDGLAIVEKNERFGMIDRNGTFVFDCIFEDLGILSEGLSYGLVADSYGYYNRNMEMVIAHLFDDAYDFHNGVAKVEKDGMQGIINKEGDFVVPAVHETILKFQDTLYIFGDDGSYGLMNDSAQIFVAPEFTSINLLKEGFAVAAFDDRLVYLDSAGTIVIDNGLDLYPNYPSKAEFNHGIAVVAKDGKYGRINTKGKVVTDFKFKDIGIGENLFPAEKEDGWGIFNTAGKAVVAPEYDMLLSAENGNFIANLDDTLGVIDPQGNILVPISFEEVVRIKDNLYLVSLNGKYGVYKDEHLMVPVQYDQIGMFNEDYLFLNKGDSLSYFDIKREEVVTAKE